MHIQICSLSKNTPVQCEHTDNITLFDDKGEKHSTPMCHFAEECDYKKIFTLEKKA